MESAAPDAVWDPDQENGLTIGSLLKDREIHILFIAAMPDFDLVRVLYVDEKRKAVGEWNPSYGAWIGVRDDIGTAYDDWGGATGIRHGGDALEGEFDVHPIPPPGASWLEVTYRPYDAANVAAQAQFTLRIPLPIQSVTLDEWVEIMCKFELER